MALRDSLSLREFLRLRTTDRVPDHSWLSKTRSRLAAEVHETVFGWVLALIAGHGLVKGERIGVDASTMEANAALRTIVRRDSGETYREMLKRMAAESGIETPSAEDLVRLDRARKGKKLSNADWVSKTDPEAKIARMKDGTTHLAYKPEHAVDLDTGAVVAGLPALAKQAGAGLVIINREQTDLDHLADRERSEVGGYRGQGWPLQGMDHGGAARPNADEQGRSGGGRRDL